jgi:hypothetical protein
MTEHSASSGSTEAIIIIKAAPQVGQRHGETVCCAGIDLYGHWLRLYPVSFRTLEGGQKFGRWDRIKFKWQRPNDDPRPESRRVNQQSIEIVGELKASERGNFLAKSIVSSLARERETGRSLALLKPEILDFKSEKKSQSDLDAEIRRYEELRAQADLFAKQVTPYRARTAFDTGIETTTGNGLEPARIGKSRRRSSTGLGSTARRELSRKWNAYSARSIPRRACC